MDVILASEFVLGQKPRNKSLNTSLLNIEWSDLKYLLEPCSLNFECLMVRLEYLLTYLLDLNTYLLNY
jgi:hypothetical protein